MRIVLLGAPGSGKGTQAAMLKAELKVPHISTGDLLRAAVAAGTSLGRQAKTLMEAGQLVPDNVVLGMLEERLAQPDVCNGFILDGYPRNLAQCEALEKLLQRIQQPLDVALKLNVPNEVIVSRCELRYKQEGRKDDKPETVRERLLIYAEQTAPVAQHFAQLEKLVEINGVGEMNEVFRRMMSAVTRTPTQSTAYS